MATPSEQSPKPVIPPEDSQEPALPWIHEYAKELYGLTELSVIKDKFFWQVYQSGDTKGVALPLPEISLDQPKNASIAPQKSVLIYTPDFFGVIPITPPDPQAVGEDYFSPGTPRRPKPGEVITLINELKKPREGQLAPRKLIFDICNAAITMAHEDLDTQIEQKQAIERDIDATYSLIGFLTQSM